MSYKDTPYFHAGRASDLEGKDRTLYRLLELVPAVLSVGSILGTIILSYFAPVFAALFIIVFDLYWLLKTIYLSIYLRQNWKRVKHNLALDWRKMLEHIKYEHVYHMILLPYFSEGKETIEKGLEALVKADYDHSKIIIVLAAEGKRGKSAIEIGEEMKRKYESKFGHFILTIHPENLPGEMAGKGSNISYACEETKEKILDKFTIPYEDVIVSAFDIDTVVYPQYLLCLTWHFLTAENPYRSSFQPVPFYFNNIWEAPVLSRVVSGSGTFWQMIQQERPEQIVTFSSHAVSFKTLHDLNYWQRNMVSDDSRIFWNAYMEYNGDYQAIPLSYPVSMDVNLSPTFWQTMKNIYKQQRRWAWGAENIPYILMGFLKNKAIPKAKKLKMIFIQLEGYWSLATNPLFILLLGWLPLVLGGRNFNSTVLSYNLPIITRNLMTIAMVGLIVSACVFWSFLPKPPGGLRRRDYFVLVFQWLLIPITIVILGAFPALDAQIRLFLGKYMGFWVTPKYAKKDFKENNAH